MTANCGCRRDVKALLRVAVVHNVAIACNRATADFILSSPLMNQEYAPSFTPEHEDSTETQIRIRNGA